MNDRAQSSGGGGLIASVIGATTAMIVGLGVMAPILDQLSKVSMASQDGGSPTAIPDMFNTMMEAIPVMLLVMVLVVMASAVVSSSPSSGTTTRSSRREGDDSETEPLWVVLARAVGLVRKVSEEEMFERLQENYADGDMSMAEYNAAVEEIIDDEDPAERLENVKAAHVAGALDDGEYEERVYDIYEEMEDDELKDDLDDEEKETDDAVDRALERRLA